MDVGVEEEGDEVVEQVLEEIGIDFNQAVSRSPRNTDCSGRQRWLTCAIARRDTHGNRQSCRCGGQNCTGRWGRKRR
jgi:charged multivesicular body protein 2A